MRNFHRLSVLLAFAAMAVAPPPARAQVSVGDEISPSFKTIDGQLADARVLRGKILVLDFWATWCPPCMAAVPDMVKLNEKYRGKGVVIIGISVDHSIEPLKQAIVKHDMNWVHVYDANRQIRRQFGVDSYPTIFVVGPDSTVLWEGDPDGLEEALADAFRNHPPIIVDPKLLKGAQETLAQVTQKLESGDAKAAMKLMAKVPPEASKDAEFATAVGATRKKLDEAGAELLEGADESIAAGKFVEAADRLRELSVSLAGLPVAADAKRKLNELMAKPEARKSIELAQKESQAAVALAEAEKLRAAKKNEAAYPRYKQIAKSFAGTPSGDKAAAVLKTYQADKAFMETLLNKEAGGKARAALSVARSYAKAGRSSEAARKYEAIIKNYPNSEQATAARTELNSLQR